MKRVLTLDLGPIERVRRRCMVSAMFDVLACSRPSLIAFRYLDRWRDDAALATIDDGGGDFAALVLRTNDAMTVGFAHESEMSPWMRASRAGPTEADLWPGLYDEVPAAMREMLDAPELRRAMATFCYCAPTPSGPWQSAALEPPDDAIGDGSRTVLEHLLMTSAEFLERTRWYYDLTVPDVVLQSVDELQPITEPIVEAFGRSDDVESIRAAARHIGWPES